MVIVVRGMLFATEKRIQIAPSSYQTNLAGMIGCPRRARSAGGKTSQEGQMPLPSAAA
jgi:hypothetical protein